MSVSFTPIGNWSSSPFAAGGDGPDGLGLLAEAEEPTGAWRWFALGLRLAAVLLCLIAALRPSVVFKEKKKQPATLVFLLRRLDRA